MPYRDLNDQDEGDVHQGTRVCRTCDARKSMVEFHWAASKRHRVRTCKKCSSAKAAKRRSERSEQTKAAMRADSLRRDYGLTPESVKKMQRDQEGCCALCRKLLGDRFHIDHDHASGFVRALLCHNCNLGLGHFYDDDELMLRAADYIRHHRERVALGDSTGPRLLTRAERAERRRAAALAQHQSDDGQAKLRERRERFRGESAFNVKLDDAAVREIRSAYAVGNVSQRELGDRFGISQSTVSQIILKQRWAHVDSDLAVDEEA